MRVKEEESRSNGEILLFGENLETSVTFAVLTHTHCICDLNMSLILTNKLKAVLKDMCVKGRGIPVSSAPTGPHVPSEPACTLVLPIFLIKSAFL